MKSLVSSLFAITFLSFAEAHTLADFGAINGVDTTKAAQKNAQAFGNAIDAANQKLNGDNTVVIPAGTTYTMFPVVKDNFSDIKIVIDGTILCGSD